MPHGIRLLLQIPRTTGIECKALGHTLVHTGIPYLVIVSQRILRNSLRSHQCRYRYEK